MSTLSFRNAPGPGHHLLVDIGHLLTIVPGMMMIIVAVVAGAWGAIVSVALGASQPLAIAVGAALFILTIAVNAIYGRRRIQGWSKRIETKFPSPPEVK